MTRRLLESGDVLLIENADDRLLEIGDAAPATDPYPMTLTVLDSGHTLSLYERTFTFTLKEGR